jgi:hypothetical protein
MSASEHDAKKSTKREELARAIQVHQQALEAVVSAKITLQKALDLASALSAELAGFSGLDDEIARARTASMKAVLAVGETHFEIDEPEGFASRLVSREVITARLEQVSGTISVLEKELSDAQAEAARLDFAREHAAEKVLAAETERRAIAHLEKIEELRKEHYIITALATRYVRHPPTANSTGQYGGVSQRRAQMPGSVHGVAMENVLGDYEARGGMRVRHAMGLAAQAYWQALKNDADVQFADFEPQDEAPKQAAE